MSQQALDLRRSTQIVRQHKVLVGIVVALGILGGVAWGVLKPPMFTSTALIALPASASIQGSNGSGQALTPNGTDPFTATQEVVAGSYQVLLGALPDVRPARSLTGLRHYVQIGSPSPDIISVTAQGKTSADAEATANAVARSYIRYVSSSRSAVGRVQAHLLASAANATQSSPLVRTVIYALLGALAGGLIGIIAVLAIGRNDRRLRQRDEIANAIGIPVIASVPVAHPTDAAGWTKLFEDYAPAARHSWQLLTALDQLGIVQPGSGRRASYDRGRSLIYDGGTAGHNGSGPFSLAVVSLSSDAGAVALGPQLAIFAASQGIPTSLVIGPQQDTAATASLRVACAAPPSGASKRPSLLRVIASDDGRVDLRPGTALIIVVAVVDSRAPVMPATLRTNTTVLGVSAGKTTAEQLARAAVVAAADGREITGILVADPLETDQTTGRVPHMTRPTRPRVPNRLRGVVTESRR